MSIPSPSDWGEIEAGDPEARSARDSFFGKTLVDAACQIAQRQVFYAATPDIYGTFSDVYEQIRRLVEQGS